IKSSTRKSKASPPDPLRIVIETRGLVLDSKGKPVVSAYGPVGAALLTRGLQELAKRKNIPIEITHLTEASSVAALRKVNDKLDIKNVNVEKFPDKGDRVAWLDRHQPSAYVAIDPAGATNAVPTMMSEANNRKGTTTFAIGDGTNANGLATVKAAEHS